MKRKAPKIMHLVGFILSIPAIVFGWLVVAFIIWITDDRP